MRVPVADSLPISSHIRVTTLNVPDDLDDFDLLVQAAYDLPGMKEDVRQERLKRLIDLKKRKPPKGMKYTFASKDLQDQWQAWVDDYKLAVARTCHSAKIQLCTDAIRSGHVVPVVDSQIGPNLILRGFWEDLFARFAATPSSNQTLAIKYLALGLDYTASDFNQEDLYEEHYRDVPDETYDNGVSTYTTTLYLKKTEGNPTGNTTVSSSTTTVITVASATGFIVGNRIQVETANNVYTCTITNIAGNDLTINNITGGGFLTPASAFDVADTPQSGDTVISLISEGGCVISEAATASANTGKLLNRKQLATQKLYPSGLTLSLLFDYILAGTSIE